jgi:Planctomycete cytochrome C
MSTLIFEANCLDCHLPPSGEGYITSGLDLETYETLMKGTLYGPVILPGDSRHSILNMLVEGRADASLRMPHIKDHPLADKEIEILRCWVDQGAINN